MTSPVAMSVQEQIENFVEPVLGSYNPDTANYVHAFFVASVLVRKTIEGQFNPYSETFVNDTLKATAYNPVHRARAEIIFARDAEISLKVMEASQVAYDAVFGSKNG